ncbi:Beta-ketoacyl-[acyl-carrier-protein] synthase FabY [Thalassocella blandensis]|nr:Beta-ketoacyl-[acyl-carrier-protein] synthase FabY [Thalassocella blandensis]
MHNIDTRVDIMSSKLPVIVGFGGYNAAGRSSGHQAYKRMIWESLPDSEKQRTHKSLASLMNDPALDQDAVLQGTLVRKIEKSLFDVDHIPTVKKVTMTGSDQQALRFTLSRRQMPEQIPSDWKVEPLDEGGRNFQVTLTGEHEFKLDSYETLAVKAAGQLPSGFDPGSFYRSQHHPRGLQMAVMGASDAVHSLGIDWQVIADAVSPDDVSVYSASIMSQLDSCGYGGLFSARSTPARVTSKQLALGLNTMPADFVNAYVLGNLGSTGAIAGACATFLYNLKQGVEDIRTGRKQVVVVGASEAPILPEVIDGYAAMSALATDADLMKLDGVSVPDYRRASRPFGHNCGFTVAESSQYVVLMSDALALELGAKIYGAVPGVYVNADGYKKSISAPGAGNYITMAKAVGLASTLLGEEAVKQRSFIQAHGSSTPQNRLTESKIFDVVAKNFGIESWPVAAVKAYLGHSLAAASGDQLAATLGVFAHGILPGIKTMDEVAEDVFADRLKIDKRDQELGAGRCDVAFLNSKGFGGNNATAAVFSPDVVERYLTKHYGKDKLLHYRKACESTEAAVESYVSQADQGKFNAIYEFGNHLIDEEQIELAANTIKMPGSKKSIRLDNSEGFEF